MTPVGPYRVEGRLASVAGGPLYGDIAIPGDKSISHRALIVGALAHGRTTISGLLESVDVLRTAQALRQFGIDVRRECAGRWSVEGGPWQSPGAPIDCGNSGTTARLLIGAAAARGVAATFTGDSSLQSRPMRRVTAPLAAMGLQVSADATLPLTVRASHLHGIRHRLETPSAQVKSAILLAGLGCEGPVEIEEPVACRDHSEIMLAEFGCAVDRRDDVLSLGTQRQLRATDIDIPSDPSSAAFPLVAACIVPGSRVMARGVSVNPTRTGWMEIMRGMGALIDQRNLRTINGEPRADLTAEYGSLRAIHVPADRAPASIDEYPILAVAAAAATGTSIFEGLGELRVKESDRLDRIVSGLRANGVDASVEGDRLIVHGQAEVVGGSRVDTHGDHRIAMSFLVLGCLAQRAIEVDAAEMIETSFPTFIELMGSLGAGYARAA